jgi:hypothetical protein
MDGTESIRYLVVDGVLCIICPDAGSLGNEGDVSGILAEIEGAEGPISGYWVMYRDSGGSWQWVSGWPDALQFDRVGSTRKLGALARVLAFAEAEAMKAMPGGGGVTAQDQGGCPYCGAAVGAGSPNGWPQAEKAGKKGNRPAVGTVQGGAYKKP